MLHRPIIDDMHPCGSPEPFAPQGLYGKINTYSGSIDLDWNKIKNLPTIDGTPLQGDLTFFDLFPDVLSNYMKIYSKTTEEWNEQIDLVAEKNTLYVYTDYNEQEGVSIPGFKLGDGMAYLADLPFLNSSILDHIANTVIHITQEEREKWNSATKVIQDGETLIFSQL